MSKNKSGMTRQGVRDLSYIRAPRKGIVLEMPPDPSDHCDHPEQARKIRDIGEQCGRCNKIVTEY